MLSYREGYHIFFRRCLPVVPNKFRPLSRLGDDVYDHPQNSALQLILNLLADIHRSSTSNITSHQHVTNCLELQMAVNGLIDSTLKKNNSSNLNGIRQLLEKKEGIFRKNIMGKRVNYAARSVISPDPYIASGDMGIPLKIAKKLTYPESVTTHNIQEFKQLVINGSEKYPGAVAVEDEKGWIISIWRLGVQQREAIARVLVKNKFMITQGSLDDLSKVIYRHLRDGDFLITNRQPTLHKPGLMAHRARVLKSERTIRIHYINCSCFNADFDGDEINLHLPQDLLSQSEEFNIVHADHQYITPTNGLMLKE
jgi:DNA-directed RNA polymerase I subunit RPA1